MSTRDRVTVALMVLIPTAVVAALVWFPAIASVVLSFPTGTGSARSREASGSAPGELRRHRHDLPGVLAGDPAQRASGWWSCSSSPPRSACSSRCCSTGRSAGSRFYQTALYLPVVLSLALVGFIWQLFYSPRPGPDQRASWARRSTGTATRASTSGRCSSPRRGGTSGYIMLLYLAGPEGRRPSLREAAAVDGATEVKTFFQVVFPVMRPINLDRAGHHGHRVAARLRPRLGHQQGPQRTGAASRPW